MQGSITYVLILSFISPCLCANLNVETPNDNYNVMQYGAIGDGISDDTQAFSNAWSSACNAKVMSKLVIPSEKTFLVSKVDFKGPCNAVIVIQFEGKLVAPSKKEWKAGLYWITVEYLNGLIIDGNGLGELDGNGSTWWNCSKCFRPLVFHFHSCNKLTVSNLRVSNSPKAHVSINRCNGATFSNISIDSPATSPNTDGFDISSSTYISIQDSKIKSGDDCIAINGGSFHVNATRVTCGPGHGISVGSLGRPNATDQVYNVNVRNCTFIESTNGARIKTIWGRFGYAKNITYEQIILKNVKNPIIINQDYHNVLEDETQSVSVSSVTYRGFKGIFAGNVAINLNCSPSGCFDILLDQNNIVAAEEGGKASVFCRNAYGTARDTIPLVSCLHG